MTVKRTFRDSLKPLFENHRYKILKGGRGGGKSWDVADYLLLSGGQEKKRILCTREIQQSIKDSVHRLLSDRISELGLKSFYEITREEIRGKNGTLFIFQGLRHNIDNIKSIEGIDSVWIEEGQSISQDSLDKLLPSIRKDGSEVIVTFNPDRPDDPVWKTFIETPLPDSVIITVNYIDNPHISQDFIELAEQTRKKDPEKYNNLYMGIPTYNTEAVVFKGKYEITNIDREFDVYYFGADWGFANDPTVLVKCAIHDKTLYIVDEAFGVGVENDELPALFDHIKDSRNYYIIADSARPEHISYMNRQGFKVKPSKKWPGSVEDGIDFMRSFDRIIINEHCKLAAREFSLYSYKVDNRTGLVQPKLEDKENHLIDAIRYSLGPIIRKRKEHGKIKMPLDVAF